MTGADMRKSRDTVPAFDDFLRQVGDTTTFSALVVAKRRKA